MLWCELLNNYWYNYTVILAMASFYELSTYTVSQKRVPP